MKTYTIQEPDSELTEGYFTLILKYTVLFILSYFAGLLWFLFKPTHTSKAGEKLDSFMDSPAFYSYLIICVVFFLFTRRLYHKFKLGLITEFKFDENDQLTQLTLLNTFNGKKRTVIFAKNALTISKSSAENMLFGKQRILTFYQPESSGKNAIVTKLNIELSAWIRHPEISDILEKLQVN